MKIVSSIVKLFISITGTVLTRDIFNSNTANPVNSLYFKLTNTSIDIAKIQIKNSNKTLKNISIGDNKPSYCLEILKNCAEHIENQVKLEISNIAFEVEHIKELSKYLKKMKINAINIYRVSINMNNKSTESIFESFKNSNYLEELNIHWYNLMKVDEKYILEILNDKKLRKISLKNDKINIEMINKIKNGLTNNKNLKELKIEMVENFENPGEYVSSLYECSSLENIEIYTFKEEKSKNCVYFSYNLKTVNNEKLFIDYYDLKLSDLIPILRKIVEDENTTIKEIVFDEKKIIIDKIERKNLKNLLYQLRSKNIKTPKILADENKMLN